MLNILMASYIGLVVADSALTYVGISHFGMVETWQAKVLFDYYGLQMGILVSTAFCFSLGWLFWKLRGFRVITYACVSALALTELAAVINNATLIVRA